jgi:hypothetical protein
MNTAVVTTAAARAARDLLDYRQAAYDRSPTDERRKALQAAERAYRAAMRAQEPLLRLRSARLAMQPLSSRLLHEGVMSADGFAGYDAWKCSEPAPEHADPPDPHEQCEVTIESLVAEIALRDRRIEELEIENAALREGRS